MKNKSLIAFLSLALLLCVIGAVNVTLRNLRLRADFTENRLYTLSEGTRAILAKLDQPCTMKFYFSKQDKNTPVFLRNYAAQVADVLKEYQRAAKGKIILEQHDVAPDSDAEEWAQRYGLEPQGAGRGGLPVYFGLVVVPAAGREAVLPMFSPLHEDSLEYDITRLVTRAVWPRKPVIGVMTGLGDVLGGPGGKKGWVAFEELKKDYALEAVAPEAEKIPDEVAALIVIHPKDLPEATLLALDRFVLRGGRLVVCVDPLSELEHSMAAAGQEAKRGKPGPSNLGALFDAWGVAFDPALTTVDDRAVTVLRAQNGAQEKNPAFLSLKRENMAQGEVLAARLSMVMLPYAGAFGGDVKEGLAFAPLMRTSGDASSSVASQTILYGGLAAVRAQAKPDGRARTVAAKLTGLFKTAFPEKEGLKEGRSAVFLFADADFLYDSFCVAPLNVLGNTVYRPINENLVLFANVLEQAAGLPELAGIRTRGTFSRPFTRVDALEQRAAQEWQKKEQELSAKLQAAQQKLAELQRQKQGDDRFILSPEQQKQIEAFKAERARTAAELKDVRRNLNRSVEALGLRLKVVNILAVPALVALAGLLYGLRRRCRRS